ncbi:PBP1A family penicillin-binding protein [Bacteroidetes/Chlorobi group bacterium Naka2016]|jgi:penicillin-binding protein 1A|nr:MAG: PBP1A family penicillin-binding protein [Bacteroidetes/Chlorobi group bacterium Naka2016]
MKWKLTPFRLLLILVIGTLIFLLSIAIYVYDVASNNLPSLELLENPPQNYATQIFSNDGVLIDYLFVERRVPLPLDSIPKDFINALLATEDRKFFDHWGIHLGRVFRAIVKNLFSMRVKEGGSTITMQLARNLYFNQDLSLKRKIREALTSIQIEKQFTKEEILEMYINTVPFGRGAYGLSVASKIYFDKSPMELTTSECAFLVGILKAPEHYNAIVDYDKGIERRNLVLRLMYEQGYLNSAQYLKALEEPIRLARVRVKDKNQYLLAPHFVDYVRRQVVADERLKEYDLYRDGLIIYTTLNAKIQQYAKEAIEEHLRQLQETFNKAWNWKTKQSLLNKLIDEAIQKNPEYINATNDRKSQVANKLRQDKHFIDSIKNAVTTIQAGLVAIDVQTGEILAMVGASPKFINENPYAKHSLNHATQIRRQPGSAFKPFVYTAVLEDTLTPTALIECGPYSYTLPDGQVWTPQGFGNCEPGEKVTLMEALAKSINSVAARLITQYTTPLKVIEIAHKMGIESPLQNVPALSLGAGGEVTPLEMTVAFSTFAREGLRLRPKAIKYVEDNRGNLVVDYQKVFEISDAISPRIAQTMVKMMTGVINFGTGYEIRNYFTNCEAAGKTGTTNNFADAWFIGFTPQICAGVWIGFDDQRISFTGGYGYAAKAAAPIWGRLMAKIYNDPTLPYKQRKFGFLDSLQAMP